MPVNNFDAQKETTTPLSTDMFLVQKQTSVGPKEKLTYANLQNKVSTDVLADNALAVTTGWTDNADGTGDVELTFTLGGSALTEPISGIFYVSEVAAGLTVDALDTGASATKGVINAVVAATAYHFVTNATGELDMTLTSTADSYWLVFKQNDGTLLISDELAITGP